MNNPNKLRFRDVYEKMKSQKKEIKESQSQEIGDSYKKLSKYYGVDLNDLVYGPDGFMKTKYPEGFDVAADIIFLEDKWNEFEAWLKETRGIDFEAIREKNLEDNDHYEPQLTTDRMASGQWYESLEEGVEHKWYTGDYSDEIAEAWNEACDKLNVWSEPSIQAGQGIDIFRENGTDKPLYEVDFDEECEFMDNLDEMTDWADPNAKKNVVEAICGFITDHSTVDDDEWDGTDDDEDVDETLTEDVDGDEEDDELDNYSFESFAEDSLPYDARCKENWMNPTDTAGKGRMNHGECDIMWVCQGDCDYGDFETLVQCFGEYYKEATNGNTYIIVMKCRSWPGYGSYIKRTVSFKDGEPEIHKEEDQLLFDGKIEIYIEDNQFKLSCPQEDIEAYGDTISEAKNNFLDELSNLNDYADVDDGYEISYNEVELEQKFKEDMTVEDYLKSVGGEEIDFDEPIGEGEYRTYETLEESLKESLEEGYYADSYGIESCYFKDLSEEELKELLDMSEEDLEEAAYDYCSINYRNKNEEKVDEKIKKDFNSGKVAFAYKLNFFYHHSDKSGGEDWKSDSIQINPNFRQLAQKWLDSGKLYSSNKDNLGETSSYTFKNEKNNLECTLKKGDYVYWMWDFKGPYYKNDFRFKDEFNNVSIDEPEQITSLNVNRWDVDVKPTGRSIHRVDSVVKPNLLGTNGNNSGVNAFLVSDHLLSDNDLEKELIKIYGDGKLYNKGNKVYKDKKIFRREDNESLEEAAGGNALGMTVEDIAEKHGVAVGNSSKMNIKESTIKELDKLTQEEKTYLLDYMGYNFTDNEKDKKEILADISPESILSNLSDETRDWSDGDVTPDEIIEFAKHLNLLATIAKKLNKAKITEDLVEPKPDESVSEYVSRFMETKLAQKEFPNEKQRLAVAYSKFMSKKEALTEEVLDTSKLNFHNLLGKITLEYPSIVVINRFGEENTVGCKLDVEVTEDDVINFICNENILDKDILTNEEAQPLIDQVAADPKMFKAELSDVYYEKAKEKAQREILGDYVEGFEPETFNDDEHDEPFVEALKTSDTVVGVTVSMVGYDYDLRKDKGYAYATLSRKDRSDEPIWIILNYSELRDNAVYEWGEDGESTYVPYGEQSVLLDDGKGTVEQVTISEMQQDDLYYELQDETVISRDDAMEILEVTDEEMKKIEALAEKLGDKYLRPIVEELLKDHDEYYPSRDE